MNDTSATTTTVYLNYDSVKKVWETIDNPYKESYSQQEERVEREYRESEKRRIIRIQSMILACMDDLLYELKNLNQYFIRWDILDI